jgi:hypothetical protein
MKRFTSLNPSPFASQSTRFTMKAAPKIPMEVPMPELDLVIRVRFYMVLAANIGKCAEIPNFQSTNV